MNSLIDIKRNEKGKQIVSARELYLGLGLNKSNWSRWYPTNILKNDFFKEGIDWIGVRHNDEGSETMDFAISLEFAKHIAMMARTEKSHQYRNYFIECENLLKGQTKPLSAMEQLKLQYQVLGEHEEKLNKIDGKIDDLENNLPLFNVECKELQALVRKKGIEVLGGKGSQAYKDNSLRGKVYADIQHELKREFQVTRYEAIKRCQLVKAREIIADYKIPFMLKDEIIKVNNQLGFKEVI